MIDKTFWLVYKLFKLWTSFELAYKFQRYHQLLVHCLVWKCISFVLADVLKKQLKNLKDTLKKCLDKRNELTKSGAAASKLPKCKFFEQMAFLHEKTGNQPTQSNVNYNLESPEISNLGSPPSISSFRYETKSVKEPCTTPARKKSKIDTPEADLRKSLIETDLMIKKSMEQAEDEDSLYCRSLIPILKELPTKKKRLAKIKISQLLFDLQYDEDGAQMI